jgi:hypothetical protein
MHHHVAVTVLHPWHYLFTQHQLISIHPCWDLEYWWWVLTKHNNRYWIWRSNGPMRIPMLPTCIRQTIHNIC